MLTSELKGNRTLATVLFTDCVGFSARMSVNEEHTLDLIRRDLKLMKQICENFEGRVLKSTGDGLLMCFSSAVKAVECAIAIQHAIAESINVLPPSDALMHRIGIHLADMYITPTDVMGNGVNIAARLQTEADPGGICISQTVYDVAKHGLSLATEYLGPRELKNIREVVPAYKVLLSSEQLSGDRYAETAYHMEQSINVARIRKLIYYVCKNHWEHDDSKLANLSLKGIIHELLGLASSYDQLKRILNTAVGTLTKQSEYTLVADEILKGVAKFYGPNYANPVESEWVEVDSSTVAPNLQPYHQVAQTLTQHSDATRLKKLLYYICRRHWESDPSRLATASTTQLLQDIHQAAPDIDQLKKLVDKHVQTLNKRVEYALVAITLLGHLGTLYGVTSDESTGSPPSVPLTTGLQQLEQTNSTAVPNLQPTERQQLYAAIAIQLEQDSNHLRFKKLIFYVCKAQWVKDSAQLAALDTATLLAELHTLAPSAARLAKTLNWVAQNLSKSLEYAAIVEVLMQKLAPLYQSGATASTEASGLKTSAPSGFFAGDAIANASVDSPNTASPPNKTNSKQSVSVSVFDVRLGILKYTNPLKAKILAFSALYADFHFTEQDWFNLKMYELDGLLRSLLQTCRNYTDLEHLLYSTARRLQQPTELVQTADTVAKYLRAFYIHGNPALLSSLSTGETKISLDDFEVATQGLTKLEFQEQTYGSAMPPSHPGDLGDRSINSSPNPPRSSNPVPPTAG